MERKATWFKWKIRGTKRKRKKKRDGKMVITENHSLSAGMLEISYPEYAK